MKKVILIVTLMLVTATVQASTFHGDEQRSGKFGPVNGSDLIWMQELTTNYIESSPITENGYTYVMTVPSMNVNQNELGLYKLYTKNGSVIASLTGEFYGRTSPTISDGLIFIHAVNASKSNQSWLYCINESDLSIKWARVVNENIDGWWHVDSHPLVYNNTIYVLSYYDGKLYAFDFDGNREIVWEDSTYNSPYTVSPYTYPSAYDGLIFFAGYENGNHELIAIYEQNWSIKWKYILDGPIVGGIAIGQGYAFFTVTDSTTQESKLYAVNLSDPYNLSWNVIVPGRNSVWRITPAVGEEYVVIGTKGDQGWSSDANDAVLCYRITDGELVWKFDSSKGINGDVGGSPIIAGEYVFFTTNTAHGTLYALYLENGTVAWSYDLGEWCLSSPFVWNGKLIVGADNGRVYAFSNFSTLWEGDITLIPENIAITLTDGTQTSISGDSALYALINASQLGGFNVNITNSTWGLYVESVYNIPGSGLCGWFYWVNYPIEDLPNVVSEDYNLKDGDLLIWYYGCYDPNTWQPSLPIDSEYVIKINVEILKPVEIKSLSVSSVNRGGNLTAFVNISSRSSNWYVVVVSGVDSSGNSLAGISTFHLTAGQELRVPVLIHVPQLTPAGTYSLYAGVYRYDEYPENLIHVYGPESAEVS